MLVYVIFDWQKTDIYNLVNWCDDNRMAINYDKTKHYFDNYMPEIAHTSSEGA